MPYQYKREPLNDDEVNAMTNACDTFGEKFVVWTLLDTGLRLSEFADLKKDNIQWQERRLVIYGKSGPYGTFNGDSDHLLILTHKTICPYLQGVSSSIILEPL